MTVPCRPPWNAGKRLRFPRHLPGFITISRPYEISKRGGRCGIAAGNLRWESASRVTAARGISESCSFPRWGRGSLPLLVPLQTALAPGRGRRPFPNFPPEEDAEGFFEEQQCWDGRDVLRRLRSRCEGGGTDHQVSREEIFIRERTKRLNWGILQSSVSGCEMSSGSLFYPPATLRLCKDCTIWMADDTFTFVCFRFSYYKSCDLAGFCCLSSSQRLN